MNIRLENQIKLVSSQIDLTPCNGCDKCGIRCSAGVQMTLPEFELVSEYTSLNSAVVDVVATQNKQLSLGDDVFVSMCRFRDMQNGNCAVYSVRPLVCRLLGHVEWMPCPIDKVKTRADTQEALHLMRLYADEERKTFEEWQLASNIRPETINANGGPF